MDRGSICAIWAVQDKVALTSDEEKALELRREVVGGQKRVLWNPVTSWPTREFEFSDLECSTPGGRDPDVPQLTPCTRIAAGSNCCRTDY
jgi:hypothetical protein